jgi:hypothetical protein
LDELVANVDLLPKPILASVVGQNPPQHLPQVFGQGSVAIARVKLFQVGLRLRTKLGQMFFQSVAHDQVIDT